METRDHVAAELRALRQAVTNLTHGMKRTGGRRLASAADGIEETSKDVLRSSQRLAEDLERRLERLEKSVSQTVREHPKAVIGGGALGVVLVGLLLAFLFRRER